MLHLALIDYGAGNLHSARRALEAGGARVTVTDDPEVFNKADGLVLPGVGAFDPTMARLRQLGLDEGIREAVQHKPFLGICVGLQVLFEGSEEGNAAGLGLIRGQIRRFAPEPALTIPHMGWNQLDLSPDPLWIDAPAHPWTYFVHSYYPAPSDPSVVIATTQHGSQRFCAAIRQGKLWGTQFHPEKSGTVGLRMIRNFLAQVTALQPALR